MNVQMAQTHVMKMLTVRTLMVATAAPVKVAMKETATHVQVNHTCKDTRIIQASCASALTGWTVRPEPLNSYYDYYNHFYYLSYEILKSSTP